MSTNMLTKSLIKQLASYAEYNFNNNLTLINLVQELFTSQPNLFPISKSLLNQMQQKIDNLTKINSKKSINENIETLDVNMLVKESEHVLKKNHAELINRATKGDYSNFFLLGYDKENTIFTQVMPDELVNHKLPKDVIYRVYFYAFNDNERKPDYDKIIDYTTDYDLLTFLKEINELDTRYQYYVTGQAKSSTIDQNLWNDRYYQIDYGAKSTGKLVTYIDTPIGILLNNTLTDRFSQPAKLVDSRTNARLAYTVSSMNEIDTYVNTKSIFGDENTYKSLVTVKDLNEYFKSDIAFLNIVQNLQKKLAENILDLKVINQIVLLKTSDSNLSTLIKADFVLKKFYELQNKTLLFKDASLKQLIIQMIYEQSKNIQASVNNKYDDTNTVGFTPEMQDFLNSYHISDYLNSDKETNYTLYELAKYMYDLTHKLPISQKMFNLINNSDTNLNSIYEQAKNLHLQDKLKPVSKDIKNKLLALMPGSVSHNKHNIFTIYEIKHNYNNSKYHKSKLLVHGTKDYSVLNILGQGLIDTDHLINGEYSHYKLTGNGLGNGIYFSRLDQVQKSLNYTNSNKYSDQYLFVCEVHYNNSIKTNIYTSRYAGKTDLIIGEKIGSYNRDELVAKRPDQVELKYLIKITTK